VLLGDRSFDVTLEQAVRLFLRLADLHGVGELSLRDLVPPNPFTASHHLVEGPTEIRELVVAARTRPRVELTGRDPRREPRVFLDPDDHGTDQPQRHADAGDQSDRDDRPEHGQAVGMGLLCLLLGILRLPQLLSGELVGQDPERCAQPLHGGRSRRILVARSTRGREEPARIGEGDELTPCGLEAASHEAVLRRARAGHPAHLVQASRDLGEQVLPQLRTKADDGVLIDIADQSQRQLFGLLEGDRERPDRSRAREVVLVDVVESRLHLHHAPAAQPVDGEEGRDDQRQEHEELPRDRHSR